MLAIMLRVFTQDSLDYRKKLQVFSPAIIPFLQ